MKTILLWVPLALMAVVGITGSYFLGEAFRVEARDAWKAEAAQAAQWVSGTIVGWLGENYTPLTGLAILFENSSEVTPDEFLGAADALEARATSSFLVSKSVARPVKGMEDWSVEYTDDSLGTLARGTLLGRYPAILETVKVAAVRPGRIILGPPFMVGDGRSRSPLVLFVRDARGPLAIIGLIDFKAIIGRLLEIHKTESISIQIEGRFAKAEGHGPRRTIIGRPLPGAPQAATNGVVSAGAELSITCYFDERFRNGPKEELANFTLLGGTAGAILITLLVGMLLHRNRMVARMVRAATSDLAESRQ
ncbi:MAG: hypothetical protein KKB20_03885, partial [Proteobacteria bacterium]|nr:hypothetical protein [Pseudomonadota bacterium]